MRPRTRLLVAAPLLSLAAAGGVSGCAPFHAGAAATVGNSRITVDQLRGLTQKVLADQPASGATNATQAVVQQNSLGQLVSLDLLDRIAAAHGLSVTPAQVGAVRLTLASNLTSAAGSSGADPQQLAAAAGYDLDQQAQVSATYEMLVDGGVVTDQQALAALASEPDPVDYSVIEIPISSQATQQQVEQVDQQLQTDPQTVFSEAQQAGVSVQPEPVTGSQLATATHSNARHAKGEVLGPFTTSGGYLLVYVDAVTPRTASDATAQGSPERQQVFAALYAAAQKTAGVHVNPRFGAWDPTGSDAGQLPVGSVGSGAAQLSTPATRGAGSPSLAPSASPAG